MILNVSNPDEEKRIRTACENYTEFDRYRLIDARRQIKIKNSNAIIELFSGEELKLKYGKELSPLNYYFTENLGTVYFDFIDSKEPLFCVSPNP